MKIQQINKNINKSSEEEEYLEKTIAFQELLRQRLTNKIVPNNSDIEISNDKNEYGSEMQNDKNDFDSSDLLKLRRGQLDNKIIQNDENNIEYEVQDNFSDQMEQRLQRNMRILNTENNQSENASDSLNNNEDEFQESFSDNVQEMRIEERILALKLFIVMYAINKQILKIENDQSENDSNSLNNIEYEVQENSLDHRPEMPIQNNMRILNQNNNLYADHVEAMRIEENIQALNSLSLQAQEIRGQNMRKNDQSKNNHSNQIEQDMYLKNDTLTQQSRRDTDNNIANDGKNFLSNLWEWLKEIGSLGLAALVKCWAWICQCCKNMRSSSAEINDNAIIDDNNSISGSKENNTCPGVSEDVKLSNAQYIKNKARSNSSDAIMLNQ